MSRTDPHRPGAILPGDYDYTLSYSMPGGGSNPDPPWNMEAARALCESVGWANKGRMFGHMGKCGVCGARYRHGDIWTHRPTGHLVHLGHECAEKYEMLADRPDWNAAMDAQKRGRRARLEAMLRNEREADFCEAEPWALAAFRWATDLEDARTAFRESGRPSSEAPEGWRGRERALAIIFDLRDCIRRFGDVSPKQLELLAKLWSGVWCPERPPPKRVPAPTGRVVIDAVCIAAKTQEGYRGDLETKLTWKISTDAGEWLCWGSCFSPYKDVTTRIEVGQRVRFKATLQPGREPHFAFYKRPLPVDAAPLPAPGEHDPLAHARPWLNGRPTFCECPACTAPAPDAFATFDTVGA